MSTVALQAGKMKSGHGHSFLDLYNHPPPGPTKDMATYTSYVRSTLPSKERSTPPRAGATRLSTWCFLAINCSECENGALSVFLYIKAAELWSTRVAELQTSCQVALFISTSASRSINCSLPGSGYAKMNLGWSWSSWGREPLTLIVMK